MESYFLLAGWFEEGGRRNNDFLLHPQILPHDLFIFTQFLYMAFKYNNAFINNIYGRHSELLIIAVITMWENVIVTYKINLCTHILFLPKMFTLEISFIRI